jgi:hypothetical protein
MSCFAICHPFPCYKVLFHLDYLIDRIPCEPVLAAAINQHVYRKLVVYDVLAAGAWWPYGMAMGPAVEVPGCGQLRHLGEAGGILDELLERNRGDVPEWNNLPLQRKQAPSLAPVCGPVLAEILAQA